MYFTRKGYGRIYVARLKDINRVKKIIKELDEFEFDYLPKDFIVPISEYPKLIYTHKFCDLNIYSLTVACWKEGVYIFCCDNGFKECINEDIIR